jgi:hypothetical protein
MAREVKRIDIAEFRELGYLQELNRLMLHPLGLALEVVVEDCDQCNAQGLVGGICCEPCGGVGQTERLGGVWDYREDPEGILFGGDEIDREKVAAVAEELDRHRPGREAILGAGSFIQTPMQEGSS